MGKRQYLLWWCLLLAAPAVAKKRGARGSYYRSRQLATGMSSETRVGSVKVLGECHTCDGSHGGKSGKGKSGKGWYGFEGGKGYKCKYRPGPTRSPTSAPASYQGKSGKGKGRYYKSCQQPPPPKHHPDFGDDEDGIDCDGIAAGLGPTDYSFSSYTVER